MQILPTLLEELKDLQLAPFLLLSILYVCEKLTPEEYAVRVLPSLRPLFTVADPPQVCSWAATKKRKTFLLKTSLTANAHIHTQISIILIQRIDLLLKKTPKSEIKDRTLCSHKKGQRTR